MLFDNLQMEPLQPFQSLLSLLQLDCRLRIPRTELMVLDSFRRSTGNTIASVGAQLRGLIETTSNKSDIDEATQTLVESVSEAESELEKAGKRLRELQDVFAKHDGSVAESWLVLATLQQDPVSDIDDFRMKVQMMQIELAQKVDAKSLEDLKGVSTRLYFTIASASQISLGAQSFRSGEIDSVIGPVQDAINGVTDNIQHLERHGMELQERVNNLYELLNVKVSSQGQPPDALAAHTHFSTQKWKQSLSL
jgi:archaellum component FlaC